jgi:hypothetical protein
VLGQSAQLNLLYMRCYVTKGFANSVDSIVLNRDCGSKRAGLSRMVSGQRQPSKKEGINGLNLGLNGRKAQQSMHGRDRCGGGPGVVNIGRQVEDTDTEADREG